MKPDGVKLLERMAAATRRAVLVDDLVRSRLGFALVWAGSYLLTHFAGGAHRWSAVGACGAESQRGP